PRRAAARRIRARGQPSRRDADASLPRGPAPSVSAWPWHNSRMTVAAEFKIDYRQILDPAGRLVAPLPDFARDAAEVVKMYAAMTRARAFDAKAVNLQRTGQ